MFTVQMNILLDTLFCTYKYTDNFTVYNKTCLKRPLKRRSKIVFQDRLSLNAGQKYCRMLQGVAFCNTFDLH